MTPEAIDNARWLRRQSPVVSDVFWYLYDNTGEDRHIPFGPIERETGHPHQAVRRACRLLARHGLARYANGLWSDDGLAGAGYGITKEGDLAADALVAESTRLRECADALADALQNMYSGVRYIQQGQGLFPGPWWERVITKAKDALSTYREVGREGEE